VKFPPSNLKLWFAVLGGPLAWALQFPVNAELGYSRCYSSPGLPLHPLQIALPAAGVAVGLVATGICAWLYLFTRSFNLEKIAAAERAGKGSPPPIGRINFLSMVGLTVNFLAVTIMVMTAIGGPLLPACQQS
jgi:hypothetical protein